jgi:threonine/homoserine/homoserine lactone efflux protein
VTDALPAWSTLAAFTAASLALIVTPGPDMTLFVSTAVRHGRRAGFATLARTLTGLAGHTAAAALGLSALLAASAAAFEALKIAGALYLLWLAVEALRRGSAFALVERADKSPTLGAAFAKGFAVNALNPKVVLFFVTFLPQFVDATDAHAVGKLATLGAWLIALSLPVCAVMVWGAGAMAATLAARPRVMRAIDYLFAGLFGAFAVKLVAARAAG